MGTKDSGVFGPGTYPTRTLLTLLLERLTSSWRVEACSLSTTQPGLVGSTVRLTYCSASCWGNDVLSLSSSS